MGEPTADVAEIFRSIQGEGPLVGAPQVFVRFAGCDRACAFCDTPAARAHAGEKTSVTLGPGKTWKRPNPWRAADLVETVAGFGGLPVWLTGGEPLLQAAFLSVFLPRLAPGTRVGLETHGQNPEALAPLAARLRWIAADAKLPSSTGEPWDGDAFVRFLEAGRGQGLFVKAVVTAATREEEVRELFGRIASVDRAIPLVLQPVTPAGGVLAPDGDTVIGWAVEGLTALEDVRVIPQVHKWMGWR